MRLCYKQDFEKFHPSALKSTLASGIFMVLKQRDEFGRKIMILRTGNLLLDLIISIANYYYAN